MAYYAQVLKSQRQGHNLKDNKRKPIQLSEVFLAETYRKWDDIFKILKEKNFQPRHCIK